MLTTEDLERIEQIIAPILGKSAWGVRLGYSTFITLEFGEALQAFGHTHGLWHLWVYGADWRLECDQQVMAGSADNREKQLFAVRHMEGRTVIRVEISPIALDTAFVFDSGMVLRLFSTCSTGSEQWMLFVPGGYVLTLGPGTEWSYKSENAKA